MPIAPAPGGNAPAGIHARAAYLIEGNGTERWSKDADTRRPMASITKVMTAMVVIRSGDLNRTITIKRKYLTYGARHGATVAGLRPGDRFTARQLLYALLLPSGADAAYALADSYGPGWRGFVGKMNTTAHTLGMGHTTYDNFDGLPWPTAFADSTTPRDLARLAQYAMKSPTFRSVAGKAAYTLPKSGRHRRYRWTNTNRLLGVYRGTRGIKTGFTNAAGYCLLFSATRGRRTLYGVALGNVSSANRFTDAAHMLDWGFNAKTPSALRLADVPVTD
ncbi:D-alanyl-D-alanine carboxypeptidase family protein [Actinomadura barringtoniae]|uniref:D-alanyl-D-alanine carboxypeptidase family protein n=1 Tax=Actinomadura barringtoniae TaxID=1427535 RepID=UPI0027DDF782|nr:serine hydrolase [Actinomadura barringtoniae]